MNPKLNPTPLHILKAQCVPNITYCAPDIVLLALVHPADSLRTMNSYPLLVFAMLWFLPLCTLSNLPVFSVVGSFSVGRGEISLPPQQSFSCSYILHNTTAQLSLRDWDYSTCKACIAYHTSLHKNSLSTSGINSSTRQQYSCDIFMNNLFLLDCLLDITSQKWEWVRGYEYIDSLLHMLPKCFPQGLDLFPLAPGGSGDASFHAPSSDGLFWNLNHSTHGRGHMCDCVHLFPSDICFWSHGTITSFRASICHFLLLRWQIPLGAIANLW